MLHNIMGTPPSLRDMDDLFHRLANQVLTVIRPDCLGMTPGSDRHLSGHGRAIRHRRFLMRLGLSAGDSKPQGESND